VRNRAGQTALMLAASGGGSEAVDIVKLLLSHGADQTATDPNGKTAKVLARESGHSDLVKLLEDFSVETQ